MVLVDDHELVLGGLCRLMARGGLEVVGAFVAPEPALEFLSEHEADLVVVDLRLADLSGQAVVSAVRRLCPHMHVTVLTIFPDLQSAEPRRPA